MSAAVGEEYPSIDVELPLPEFVSPEAKQIHICPVCKDVLRKPVQTTCGHRLCESCWNQILAADKAPRCPVNEEDCVVLSKDTVHPDFSGRKDLKKLKVFCRFKGNGCTEVMPWAKWEVHINSCKYAVEPCPFQHYGCAESFKKEEFRAHMQTCSFKPEKCEFCEEPFAKIKMQIHLNEDCPSFTIQCQHGCGTAFKRAELQNHEESCSWKPIHCKFHHAGCEFKGTEAQLSDHEEAAMKDHLDILLLHLAKMENREGELEKRLLAVENDRDIISNKLKDISKENEKLKKKIDDLGHKMQHSQKIVAGTSEKVIRLEEEMRQFAKKDDIAVQSREINSCQKTYQDIQSRLETMEQHGRSMDSGLGSSAVGLSSEVSQHDRLLSLFNVRLAEVDLRLQMLETASYNGILMWKIRGYRRRKADAQSGKTISLYSQPFYTDPHGYKMCARVYLNGDGIGKGSHLSLFFVVMKGDYDALLPWPFRQKVTLMLLDQVGKRHLQDTFRPDPASSSFQKPQNEMNVASGCPLFVSHTVLEADGTPYIRDETIFIKVAVDTENLHDP